MLCYVYFLLLNSIPSFLNNDFCPSNSFKNLTNGPEVDKRYSSSVVKVPKLLVLVLLLSNLIFLKNIFSFV